MRPGGRKVPSIVVIQERHVRHGENFKIFRVSCKSRREYITKFMSPRRVTYRCKSRKVRMGCMLKETTYKGSPLAISRLLLLEGLDAMFPTFEEVKSTNGSFAKQEENSKSSSSLSYFNLSDRRSDLGGSSSQIPPLRVQYSMKGPPPSSTQQMLDLTIEKKCSPDSLPDFNLIFGSDTNDAEDFDSDDDQEKMAVEVVFDSAPTTNQQTEEIHDANHNSSIIVSLARMEKDIKQIVNAFEASQNRILPDLSNEEQPVDITHTPKHQDPKPSANVPPIPMSMKRSLGGQQSLRCFGDILQPSIPPIHAGQNPSINRPPVQAPSGSPHIFNIRNLGGGSNQLPFRNLSSSRALCGIVEPSGSIPFFRVPGGCFMVIHATNQTTPFLHATFVTGCTNSLQFQQTQLPVYGSHQVVAIHLGPYRLNKEEIHGVFAFACGTKVYAPCTAGRYK